MAKFAQVGIYVYDRLKLLKSLSLFRLLNSFVVVWSYFVSKTTKKNFHAGMPLSIAIEPTTACNLGCPECPSGLKQFTRKTGNANLEFYKMIIDQVKNKAGYLTLYFQGEPYINPQFLEMVKYAEQQKIYTATSTNAHFLDDENAKKTVESGLSRLIVSIDGTTQEVYEQYRKSGNLDKVLEGTRNVVKWKRQLKSKTPHIIFQYLVVKPNEHQIEEVKSLAKELGVDEVRFKTAQVYNYENGNELIPDNEKFARYKKQANGKYATKNPLENHCWKMWSSCVITWDGNIVPCCFDKDATHTLGSLQKQNFKEIWQSEAYNNFRQAVLTSRKQIDICANCSEGSMVWA